MGCARYLVSVGAMTDGSGRPSLWRKFCKLIKPDWLFALLLVFSMILLALNNQSAAETAGSPPSLYPKLLFLGGIVFFLALFATFGAALDRRKLDDYYFQLIANGATIAVVTTIATNAMWGLLDDVFPSLSADELLAVMMISWSLGYFFYRVRGLNA
jgi:quinol-cytochrome oxidoreductase complex cytochrome b subunit